MSVTAIRAPGNDRGTDIGFERHPVPGEARRIAANIAKLRIVVGPDASACALPRVWFGFIGHAFERSVVGFVVSLGLLRIGLIRLLLMFVPATTPAAHALRVSTDHRQADSECKKRNNCRCAAFHVRTLARSVAARERLIIRAVAV
jgi:hypothetical protein